LTVQLLYNPLLDLQVKGVSESELREVTLSRRIKALVVLNLQSYGGGRDVFGLDSSPEALEREGFQTPIFNDGHLEARPAHDERTLQHLREC
jgi:diacylglycerol kinase (ATP)